MIKLKTTLKSFEVATNFADITFSQYKELTDNEVTDFRKIEILTGLKPHECVYMDLEILTDHIEFLKENPFETIEESDLIEIEKSHFVLPSDIGEKSWEQKIMAVEALHESNAVRMLAIYLQPLLTKKPFDLETLEETEFKLESIPMEMLFAGSNFIKNQVLELIKRENELLKNDISFEQIRAGIDMFNQLGEFNTIDLIAQGKVWMYDTVLKIDYNTILNKLYKLNLSAKFEKNYSEIIKEQNQ